MFTLQIDTARSWRGGQNQVLLTARGLRARGHLVAVVAHPEGELRKRLGDDIEVVPLVPRNEIDLPAAWRLARMIRERQPDVVHAHDPHGVAVAAAALSRCPGMASSPRRPCLVAARRVAFHLKTNSFSRWKYRQVDCFIAASDAIRETLLQDGVREDRAITVHEGTDVEQMARIEAINLHEEYCFPAQSLVVGNIGALAPEKGQKYFVEAAELVVKAMPQARFVILGDGDLRASLELQIKQLHLGQHVLLGGFRPDVLALLKSFDLFVMSSLSEGLGTSLLDAMAASRPIVATRVGGMPEVVSDGETGLLVPPRDGRALGEAILSLLQDEGRRRRMAEAGLARVRQRFSVDRMVDETLAVYQRLSGKTHAAGASSRETMV